MDTRLLSKRVHSMRKLVRQAELREVVAAGDTYIVNGHLNKQLRRIRRRSVKRAVIRNKTIPAEESREVLLQSRASMHRLPVFCCKSEVV